MSSAETADPRREPGTRIPRATYRLQLRPDFGFEAAAATLPYLAELGISHAFCSPYLQAAPGSLHGYDVADPATVNEDLGGEAGHARWCAALRAAGLGQILDIVPNHMAIATDRNRWWWDVLQHGQASPYAAYFDIAWRPPEETSDPNAPAPAPARQLILPWLADHYGKVLEAGQLQVAVHPAPGGTGGNEAAGCPPLALRYADHWFPLAPGSLPPLAADNFAAELAELNGDPDRLDAVLGRQFYRLARWRVAARELGYRRFFDINTLAGVRVEDPAVFAATHQRILAWLADGSLDGVRVDHVDGLRDPAEYLQRLRAAAPGAWIVVEKILAPEEALPPWPVAGTTGYDFLNLCTGLLIDPAGAGPLTVANAEFTGQIADFATVARAQKLRVLDTLLGSDVRRLVALLALVCVRHRRQRDYTRAEMEAAIRRLAAAFPVYRTYLRLQGGVTTAEDQHIAAAAAQAQADAPALAELISFLRDLLLGRIAGAGEREFALRFQQLTPAAAAKGVEDTAFYYYNRFTPLNEVGGDPGHFARDPAEFHAACQTAQRHWPAAMLSTATHDTKRGEDVRARLCLLSEIPAAWRAAVERWSGRNAAYRGPAGPDRNTEYLFYQTLVGVWPASEERLQQYMLKAAKEAKARTSWREPRPRFERALRRYIHAVLNDASAMDEIHGFIAPLVIPGRINSLAQTAWKLTAPGVPDIYNGAELWDMSLVDPDNRRPVDFALRRRLLAELDAGGLSPEAIWARHEEGLPKLWLIRQALRLRRQLPDAFGPAGDYQPLASTGAKAPHVVAFLRAAAAVTVTPRLPMGLGGGWPGDWHNTALALPPGRWRNVLTGEAIAGGLAPLAALLARFPVALLAREEA
ncbi:MAG: malto-oligosyltrehalose synthase [Terriglobales bacterium]